ncbi:acetate/propionate family kinase [Filimonas effusa]|uniref:Acetate kinase n=1 Tax=Filimonas effusa TaxID=2508721 RepID=A0A4V1MAL8_9BACT|nr:acetate/propionate family kinase [Filimonas effusa]RXK86326.1 acetate/propionate family kinase [Filimonas effusa]
MTNSLLTVNTGSSSVKFSIAEADKPELLLRGQVKDIGREDCQLEVSYNGEDTNTSHPCSTHKEAVTVILTWLSDHQVSFTAAVHRLVHGGPHYSAPLVLSPELLNEIRRFSSWAPDHLPPALAAVEQLWELNPQLEQIACFDTFFHQSLPPEASSYSLPASFRNKGIRKYGFHGLSCAYIVSALVQENPAFMQKKIIIAHLGNGASITAVKDGQSVDTTMGLTPNGGLVMGSRTGDLDPGVVLYLLREEKLDIPATDDIIHHQSGLKGLSGGSSNIQELLEKASSDPAARQAIDIFCYQAAKHIGAMIAVMNGLDILVFTGGAGEKAPFIRQKICAHLGFAGVHIDLNRNQVNHPLLSHDNDTVAVKVIAANEEAVMIRQATEVLHRH